MSANRLIPLMVNRSNLQGRLAFPEELLPTSGRFNERTEPDVERKDILCRNKGVRKNFLGPVWREIVSSFLPLTGQTRVNRLFHNFNRGEVAEMFEKIRKRDGRIVDFDPSKITGAIARGGKCHRRI